MRRAAGRPPAARSRRRASAGWRVVPHTADARVAVRGRTLRALFDAAAAALLDLAGSADAARPRQRRSIVARGQSVDDLLVRWLTEILIVQEIGGWRARRCRIVRLDRRRLVARGTAEGEPYERDRHRGREIKAVTYHGLRIRRRAGGFSARVLFDV